MLMVKTIIYFLSDIEERRYREQTGLDILVVYTVKSKC